MALKPISLRQLEAEFVCQCHYRSDDDSEYLRPQREKAERRRLEAAKRRPVKA